MTVTASRDLGKVYVWSTIKSFAIWAFTLTVCGLVVGFPIVVLMATIGILLTVALQAVFPMSAVLLVASSLIGINLLLVFVGAAVLTFKGIHPQDVRWLSWLHGEADPLNTPIYAACPLTCPITPGSLQNN